METYHKIQTLFKRHLDGPKKGKMIRGQWTTPELEYLADKEWEFTEKVDGTNIRLRFYRDKSGEILCEIGGRTDNAQIPKPLNEFIGSHFYDYTDGARGFLQDWFDENSLTEAILFGEGYGVDIQNGGNYVTVTEENRKPQKFVLFDVKIGGFWLTRESVDDIATKLQIESVPTIGYGTLEDAIDIVSTGISFLPSGGIKRWGPKRLNSAWGDFEAEGIVARPRVPLFDRKGSRIITKIKAVDFR